MNENQNIPKLRFEGFTEPWEQHKLGDLAEIKDSARVPNNLWSTSGVPYIRASDVSNDDLQGVLFLFQEVFDFYRKKTGAPVRGDVLFNGGGEIGKSLFINTDQQLYAQGGAVLYARTSESKRLDGVFLSEIFQSRTVKKYIGSTSKGGTMKHFTLEPAKSMPLLIPNDVSEQHDIGFFLRDLDNLVTLYQHKYERLQHLKQALLRKMFPKPGEQVPELRFEGFTEPWKEYRLGDLGEVAMCKRIYKDQTSDSGDVPFFKIGTFGGKPDAYISNELFEEYRSKFPFPDAGDVLISAAGTIGRTVVYNGERAYYQDSNIVWLKHGDEINNLFFLQFLKVKDWKNLEGSTLKRLYNKDILETPIALPETAEQNAVGSFFRDIDSLITLHQRKYERLQRLKQALLRKMFPKPGELVPELRFNGFTEPWEERKLGELMDITSVRRVHQKDWCNSGVRFLRARDVVAYSKGEEVDDPLYISTAMYAEYSAQCGKVQKNDLLVTGVGTIGIPWLVPNDNPVYFKDGNIIWLKNRNALDGRFLYYDFMGAQIQTFIHETTGIGTVATFTIDTACKTPIIYPSQSEQHLIGSFFRDLDNLIALYRHKYERLKRLKQALLRKMFV